MVRVVSHRIRITDKAHDVLRSFKKENETDAQVLTRVTERLAEMRADYAEYTNELRLDKMKKKIEKSTAQDDLDNMFRDAQNLRKGR